MLHDYCISRKYLLNMCDNKNYLFHILNLKKNIFYFTNKKSIYFKLNCLKIVKYYNSLASIILKDRKRDKKLACTGFLDYLINFLRKKILRSAKRTLSSLAIQHND